MELFLLYLWLKINTIIFLSWIIFVCSFIIIVFTSFFYLIEEGALPTFFSNNSKKIIAFLVLFFSLGTLLPSKTDIAILAGGYYALETVKSPEGQKVVSLLRKKANEILDKELNDGVVEKVAPK